MVQLEKKSSTRSNVVSNVIVLALCDDASEGANQNASLAPTCDTAFMLFTVYL